jgi:hypothetical protein
MRAERGRNQAPLRNDAHGKLILKLFGEQFCYVTKYTKMLTDEQIIIGTS